MTKPPLGKVEALLYVLQHVTTRGCARILTHPLKIVLGMIGLLALFLLDNEKSTIFALVKSKRKIRL